VRNFNENTITDAVPERIAYTTSLRIKEVSGAPASDVVFGVKDSLIREFVHEPPGRAPDGRMVDAAYFHLNYDFGLLLASGDY